MNNDSHVPDLITYDEMHRIIREKFNATHEELRYWIKISLKFIISKFDGDEEDLVLDEEISNLDGVFLLIPYLSDIPNIKNFYHLCEDRFFYPEHCFYLKKAILQFKPSPHLRFVYLKDLTGKRNWSDYRIGQQDSSCSRVLLKANEYGILRFYDHSTDEFSQFCKESQLWCHSFDGESYVTNPESFFLLYDIINVERILFGKNKELCLNELGIKSIDLPKNVINFKKKKD